MGFYDDRVLPHLVNFACSSKPTRKQREKIVPLASGDVLEIGFGTGLNLRYYNRDRVRKIWGLEPSEGMRRQAQRNIAGSRVDVELIDLPGERIPLEDDSVDTVVVTYTLCTIEEVHDALDGMRRVLKPDGRLLFCEHGEAPDADVLRWQKRINPVWRKISGGCNVDRNIPSILNESGFDVIEDNRMYIPGVRALCYNYWGVAQIR